MKAKITIEIEGQDPLYFDVDALDFNQKTDFENFNNSGCLVPKGMFVNIKGYQINRNYEKDLKEMLREVNE